MTQIPPGARATVMGLGLFGGGLATARFLAKRGVDVLVTDLRNAEVLRESVAALEGVNVRFSLGGHREEDFKNTDVVVANPAVPPDSPWLAIARKHQIPITSELEIFLQHCPTEDMVAITGTNGKTTTTTLAAEILKLSKKKLFTGGNIGRSLLEALGEIGVDDAVLLEISSFQLDSLRPPRAWPRAGAITNMSPDHLDWHRTMDAYIAAKRRMFEFQDSTCTAVLNYSDPIVKQFRQSTAARIVYFSRDASLFEKYSGTFFTVRDSGGSRYFVENNSGVESRICDVRLLTLAGDFQHDNVLAAAAVTRASGAPLDAIARAVEGFRGVAHRLQPLAPVHNIRIFDNAVSTVPESTISALESMDGRVHWIAGGKSKGLDLTSLARAAARSVAHVYIYGDAARELESALLQFSVPATVYKTLSEAFAAAKSAVKHGDSLLYSPAFPSFDQYRNYKERGAEFLVLVKRWQNEGRHIAADAGAGK